MKFCLLVIVLLGISQTKATIIDILAATNGHEPSVAVNCGKVPFYMDLETGAWVADSRGVALCDNNKEDVKKFCQETYKNLNISNIVEANRPLKFTNWCEPGLAQCDEEDTVEPYRCLVNEYEADALMVPDGCKFDHLHNPEMCLSHGEWKKQALGECKRKYHMTMRDYGILLSCKTDYFTGVEFVCCPKKMNSGKVISIEKEITDAFFNNGKSFSEAIAKFQKYIPVETIGCDRTNFLSKRTAAEEHHKNQIAGIVDEWDEAERRYNKLKMKDAAAAEEKMKRTLEVFRETLAALEQESNSVKNRLRAEHADCINKAIAKEKHDAMLAYLVAIEEKPANADRILATVRQFIQVCEHDRVHSLRHFEHVRNRDEAKADSLRGELLQHLKDLNKVVNESMALLNYLPEIAEEFGITSGSGAVLRPRIDVPTEDDHMHNRVKEILDQAGREYPITNPAIIIPRQEEDKARDNFAKFLKNVEIKPESEMHSAPSMAATEKNSHIFATDDVPNPNDFSKQPETKTKQPKTDQPKTNQPKTHRPETHKPDAKPKFVSEIDDAEDEKETKHHKHHGKKSVALTAVLGLSCGVVVVMLFVVLAMMMRKHRFAKTRVVIADNNDDREHLVEMQKNGFENPTYKFFYY